MPRVKASSESDIWIYEVPYERIDNETYKEIEDELLKKIVDKGPYAVMDMKNVKYMSSIGVRTIMTAANSARKKGGDMILCNLQDHVSEVFVLSGLKDIIRKEVGVPSSKKAFITGYDIS